MKLSDLRVKIYADGADLKDIIRDTQNPLIKGFTTNPTLMLRSGVDDYSNFARAALEVVGDKPISFEVFADEPEDMFVQGLKISKWGPNVYVKIPITNTRGSSTRDAIRELSLEGVKVNITAVVSLTQVTEAIKCLVCDVPAIISVFAGRVADTGLDAGQLMFEAGRKLLFSSRPNCELLWASTREPYNLYEADKCGCDIITVPHAILEKATAMSGRDLEEVSLETVRMFYNDAKSSGYTL